MGKSNIQKGKRKKPWKKFKQIERKSGSKLVRGVGTALRLGRLALSMLNSESKIIPVTHTLTAISSTGSLTLLNALAQGTGQNNRIGDEYRMKSIFTRFAVTHNSSGSAAQSLRFMVVKDKQPNGSSTSPGNILDTASYLGLYDADHMKRYTVYCDETYTVSVTGNQRIAAKCYVDLSQPMGKYDNNNRVECQSNNGDITDISTNAYYILVISSDVTNGPTFTGFTRSHFIDN